MSSCSVFPNFSNKKFKLKTIYQKIVRFLLHKDCEANAVLFHKALLAKDILAIIINWKSIQKAIQLRFHRSKQERRTLRTSERQITSSLKKIHASWSELCVMFPPFQREKRIAFSRVSWSLILLESNEPFVTCRLRVAHPLNKALPHRIHDSWRNRIFQGVSRIRISSYLIEGGIASRGWITSASNMSALVKHVGVIRRLFMGFCRVPLSIRVATFVFSRSHLRQMQMHTDNDGDTLLSVASGFYGETTAAPRDSGPCSICYKDEGARLFSVAKT